MPLSREFKATVRERVQLDPKFGEELFREAMESLLAGDLELAKAILRDYVNATVGFQRLSDLTHRPVKSLMRMLSPRGNPQAKSLLDVIGRLQEQEGLALKVQLHPRQ